MAIDGPSDSLPLADVLRAANDLVTAGLIEDWALGGALAAIYYVEPFTTYDADIFFIPKERGPTAGVPAKVFRAEHIVAIAASVDRAKDKARIEQLLQQADLNQSRLENILQRHKLKLPKP